MEDLEEQDLQSRDGIAIVYNPLIPNYEVIPGFNPLSVSTWSVQMGREESERLREVAEVCWRLYFDLDANEYDLPFRLISYKEAKGL